MHSIQAPWRSPSFILGIIAVIAMMLYNSMFVERVNFEGYWISTFANASIFLIFSCPVGSASAAIVAARARRAGIWSLPLARGRAAITFRLLLPSFMAAFVAQLYGLSLLASATWGAPGRIPYEILLAWVAILIFHISTGYLIGRYIPVAASIPLAIFVSYCWLGFTWSVSYFPIRYLSGLIIASCCNIATTIDERSVVAVVIFSALMSIAFLALATIPPAGVHWSVVPITGAATIACIAAAFTVGLNVASGLPAQPVTPRGTDELMCAGRAPAICLYPEQLQHNDPRSTLETAYNNIQNEGISLSSRITTSNTEADRSSLRIVVTTQPTTSQLVYTIAAALIPDDVAPYCGDGSDYPKRIEVAAVAIWWLQTVAGKGLVDKSSIAPSAISPDSLHRIQTFGRLSDQQQRAWYFSASPALVDCASTPIEIPER